MRLALLLTGSETPNLTERALKDMREFIKLFKENPVNPAALGVKGVKTEDIIEVLEKVYGENPVLV